MRNETVIFLHIPKTAGTTLRRILENQYAPDEQYSTYPTALQPHASLAAFSHLDEAHRLRIRLLMGHMPFGLHAFLPQPSRYFTILRDPVERVVSHYYFLHRFPTRNPSQQDHTTAMTLQHFVENPMIVEAKNLQTRMISGVMNQEATKTSDEALLTHAKHNLREAFDVIGLAERFDETLLLLKNAFHWRQVFYVKLNVTRARPQQDGIAPEIRSLIQKNNQLDLDLYRYAQELFAEQLHRQGTVFAQQLRSFQARNRLLQPLLHVWWRSPHAVSAVMRKVKESISLPHAT